MILNLSKGFTDNMITRVDGLVVKSGLCVSSEMRWYESYLDKADIPYVMGEKYGALVMKYIERAGEIDLNEVVTVVKKYSRYKPINDLPYISYVEKIHDHLVSNQKINNGDKLLKRLLNIDLAPTFSHGDLSTYNIIPTLDGLKLIDPLYSEGKFGSYILDYAKLIFSLRFFEGNSVKSDELQSMVIVPECFIASECVRVATYKKQFSFIAENLINEL